MLDVGLGRGAVLLAATEVVGPTGQVLGVDLTQDMLDLLGRNCDAVTSRTPPSRGWTRATYLDEQHHDSR